jgi:hypothetical protein
MPAWNSRPNDSQLGNKPNFQIYGDTVRSQRISGAAWCVGGISFLFWVCAGLRAIYRPLWYDELITWHVARLPTLAAMWSALNAGVDQSLPLLHLTVRLSHAAFGYSALATRLPALAGYWIMLLGLYLFLRRRLPTPSALIGMVFPMLTYAWAYAFEARSYGILLGAAALALVSWQAAAEGRLRPLSLIGIAAGLAAALASHYTAVLLAVPFALGEAVRTIGRRKLDPPVWIAFAAAVPVTLMYPGLLAVTRDWDLSGLQTQVTTVSSFYSTMLRAAITPLLLAGIAAYALVRNLKDQPQPPSVFPRHEAAALLGFVLAPVLFMAAGMVSSHSMFFPRYGILCVIGIAAWCAALMHRATAGNRRAAVAALLVLVGWLAAARGNELRHSMSDPRVQFEGDHPVLVQALNDGRPVVVPDPYAFLAADFYLPPPLVDRIHYPINSQPGSGRDISDRLVAAAARNLPVRARVDTWSDFEARRQPFLLLTDEVQPVWMCDLLLRSGWRLTLRARSGLESLFDVAPPP